MTNMWNENILSSLRIVQQNNGLDLVTVVSGTETDRMYWQEHFNKTSRDVFRRDGTTSTISISEITRKGNFLGTINAWNLTKQAILKDGGNFPSISLMSMVFGEGKRLSPFTQALGNRKPAFPTPMWGAYSKTYLRMADLSNLYNNILTNHLEQSGFQGYVVKWGDEAIIPGLKWNAKKNEYFGVDAIRSVFKTDVTPDLAREKDWVLTDTRTGLMRFQYSRQDINSLKQRISELGEGSYDFGVNLGSLALSYDFLEIAAHVLQDDVADPRKWVDWDPYVWIALFCRDKSEWEAELSYEDRCGKTGIRDLEARYPDFYIKISKVRAALEAKTGRSFTVRVLDFGDILWTDYGLHLSLRKSLDLLTTDFVEGRVSRELFGIANVRDQKGNIIIRSSIPEDADIQRSVIVDTIIKDPSTIIHEGVIVGGRHKHLFMPFGGSALFCAADTMKFIGMHGVAFRSIGSEITILDGGRHTSLFFPEIIENMVSNETILDYSGKNYYAPVLGNHLSFEEAGKLMAKMDGKDIESRWLTTWQNWLL